MSNSRLADHAAFIAENTRLQPIPFIPEISLCLTDEAMALWQKTEDELEQMGLPPPFWAFAWAGGQALARHILDNPGIVSGKRVLDFASGSGLVAIAAAKAGAALVDAADIDCFAVEAIRLNAAANGVSIQIRASDLVGAAENWDVVLAGDISYERDMAERATNWLEALSAQGAQVLIGDPGRTFLARDRLESIAEFRIPVTRALEDSDIKRTQVWRFRRNSGTAG